MQIENYKRITEIANEILAHEKTIEQSTDDSMNGVYVDKAIFPELFKVTKNQMVLLAKAKIVDLNKELENL